MIHLRLIIFFAGLPFSIQVATVTRKSVVALGDSVWIEHRDYLKQKLGSQHAAVLVISN